MTELPKNYYRISIKALILDEQKRFLLFLEQNGLWELPGGGLDFGENPQDCLARELYEEAGLDLKYAYKKPEYFLSFLADDGIWKANVIFEVLVKNLEFKRSDECTDLRFFTKEDVLRVKHFPSVREFAKVYNPANHI